MSEIDLDELKALFKKILIASVCFAIMIFSRLFGLVPEEGIEAFFKKTGVKPDEDKAEHSML